jgi:hypothetical protein
MYSTWLQKLNLNILEYTYVLMPLNNNIIW